jgi:hypothetical protein
MIMNQVEDDQRKEGRKEGRKANNTIHTLHHVIMSSRRQRSRITN